MVSAAGRAGSAIPVLLTRTSRWPVPTVYPASVSRRAVSAPRPLGAPVTSAVLVRPASAPGRRTGSARLFLGAAVPGCARDTRRMLSNERQPGR